MLDDLVQRISSILGDIRLKVYIPACKVRPPVPSVVDVALGSAARPIVNPWLMVDSFVCLFVCCSNENQGEANFD